MSSHIEVGIGVRLSIFTGPLWLEDILMMWDLGVRGKTWRVMKEMYRVSRSAELLDDVFSVYQWPFEGSGTGRARGGTK